MKYSAEDIRKYYKALKWQFLETIDFASIIRKLGGTVNPSNADKYYIKVKGIPNPLREQWLQAMLFLRMNELASTDFSSSYLGSITALKEYLQRNKAAHRITDWLIYAGFPAYLRSRKETVRAACFFRAASFYHSFFVAKDSFEQNRWYFKEFNLPRYRYNEMTGRKKLDFWGIQGEENVRLIKVYIKNQILHEEVGAQLISARLNGLKILSNFMEGRSLLQIRASELITIFKRLGSLGWANNYFNAHLSLWENFYIFYIQEGKLDKLPIAFSAYKKKNYYKPHYVGVSDYLLRQLYENIPNMPEDIGLMLLILIHTGMYLSQICSLEIGCLLQMDGQHVIRYYHNERRREVFSPVPGELARKILTWQERRLKEDRNAMLLFISPNGKAFLPSRFQQNLQAFIDNHHIINEDGTSYRFRTKEFRHAFAYRMLRNHVPVILVQRLMHHRTIQMSLLYKEQEEQARKLRYLEFINNRGEVTTILDEEERQIEDDLRWLRHMIQQALPNGYCGLPVSMGKCPHANACLTCSSFRTTKEFLPILRYQLVKLERMQALFLRGQNESCCKVGEQINILTQIISRLEDCPDAKD